MRPLHPISCLWLRVLLAAALFAPGPGMTQAQDDWVRAGADGRPELQLYFFWSASCPHCLEAQPFLITIPLQRPWVRLHAYEVSRHPEHARRYVDMAAALGERAESVPAMLFCGEMRIGWHRDDTTGAELLQALDACHARLLAGAPAATANPGATAPLLTVPVLGNVDAGSFSLPLLTVALAGLDAFNPCAFFVLLFLLSLLVHQKRRGRMLLIGGIFVLCSGLMYFAFMAAWLNLFQLLGNLAWVTLAAGLLAVVVGAVNVKDYFAFGRGVTLSIPDSRKPSLYRRARAILNADSLPAMLAATVLLAVAANFYELLCTAGFPMVYTRVLTLSGLTPAQHYLYLALYNLVYVLPLTAIVLLFVRTLGARKMSGREGRLLKLLSGLMMLLLGLVLILAPERLNNLAVALGLLAVAVALTLLAAKFTPADAPARKDG
ncbi:MAG: hypothetical protein ACLGH6_02640 [Gammaproteobacteria bacterium]